VYLYSAPPQSPSNALPLPVCWQASAPARHSANTARPLTRASVSRNMPIYSSSFHSSLTTEDGLRLSKPGRLVLRWGEVSCITYTYWLKIAKSIYPTCIQCPCRWVTPSEFRKDAEESITCEAVLTQQMDGHNSYISTVHSIAVLTQLHLNVIRMSSSAHVIPWVTMNKHHSSTTISHHITTQHVFCTSSYFAEYSSGWKLTELEELSTSFLWWRPLIEVDTSSFK